MKGPIGRIISSLQRHNHIYVAHSIIKGNFGIGPGQVDIFLSIARNEGLHQKDIGAEILIEKATVAKGVKKLLDGGYVRTETDPVDKRHTRVLLTDKGHRILPFVEGCLETMEGVLFQGLSQHERNTAAILLEKMNRNIVAEVRAMKP